MKTMLQLFLLIIFVFILNTFGQKTENAEPKDAKNPAECASDLCEVTKAEKEYITAFTSPSLEPVDKLHTDDFLMTSGNPARTTSKTDIMSYMKNFGTRVGAVITVNTIDLKVRFYGQTAVTNGIWKTTAQTPNGKPVNKSEKLPAFGLKKTTAGV